MTTCFGISCVFFGASCVGTTGGELIAFETVASGPEDAVAGELRFVTDRGWNVTLTTAKLHVGAVYLNRSMPVSGVQNTSCILPDTYLAQVTSAVDVDMLSPAPQLFPALGEGMTTPPAIVAQVWLTGGRIDRIDDRTPILKIAGVAEKGSDRRPFSGTVTIGSNRIAGGTDSTQAGASPICNERIVSPIPVSIALTKGGSLRLRLDPRFLFTNVDFAALPPRGDAFAFTDDVSAQDQPSFNLYGNLRAASPLYALEWVP
ncbi:MAG: hypothetical protein ABW133_17860 [Polyangiaceae bacterium]